MTVNTPATGTPRISGTARAGETLSATTGAIRDTDGVTGSRFSYRWVRLDGAETTTVGTESARYTVVADDEGKRIRVEVSFTDDRGFVETRISDAVEVQSPATGAPEITGTAGAGLQLVADTSGIADANGLDVARFSYRWIRVDGTSETRVGTAVTYTAVRADVGKRLKVEVSFTDDADFDEGPLASALVTVRNTAPTGAPEITGTARIGETLGATTQSIVDPDGLANVGYLYNWLRIDGMTETPIPGETARTYTVVAADLGKRIRVRVAFTDDLGGAGALASVPVTVRAAHVPAVCPALPDLATGRVRFWSGTVGVAPVVTREDAAYGHGFAEGNAVLGAAGALTPGDFRIGARTYTVRAVLVATGGSMQLQLDRRLTGAEVATLVLHVCGEAYAFSEAQYSETIYGTDSPTYVWPAASTGQGPRAGRCT